MKTESMDEFMSEDLVQGAGWTTVFLAIGSGFIELLTHVKLNDVLQFILSVGGLVFMWYKIRIAILDMKIKKKSLNEDEGKK